MYKYQYCFDYKLFMQRSIKKFPKMKLRLNFF